MSQNNPVNPLNNDERVAPDPTIRLFTKKVLMEFKKGNLTIDQAVDALINDVFGRLGG